MAATIQIHEMTASNAGTDKTNGTVRFKLADNMTVDLNDPMTIPSSGVVTTRSFTKCLRLFMLVGPTSYIDNIRCYTYGGSYTGVTINASNVNSTEVSNASNPLADGTSVLSYTSAAPLDLDANHTASYAADHDHIASYFGDMVALQCVVASNAVSGPLTATTLVFAYDEI